jgi:hypothetical protein
VLAPSETKAARKQRRQRDRHKRGAVMLTAEVIEADFAEALLMAGALTPEQALDRRELSRGLEMVAREWTAIWLRRKE